MVKFLQRFSKPTHTVGTTIAVPHNSFVQTPTMSPLKVAFNKGAEAKRRGRKADNPYDGKLLPNDGQLAAEWMRGYGS